MKWDVQRDYYADLGLKAGATPSKIKTQYRKLALKYHPDRNPGREREFTLKFQAIQAANEILISPRQRGYYDAGRLEAGYDAAKPSPKTPRTPRQTKARRQTTPRHRSTAPHQTTAPHQSAAPPQAAAPPQTTAPNETTAPRQTAAKPHTYQALREVLRASSLQQNLAAQRAWLVQNFGFVESPRDSPIILKSLNARERALLHLAVQSFGHNLYSKSVTVCNGERWTCVGNRYAVVSNMNLVRRRDSREEQLEQEERQRVHDEGYQTLVDAWNNSNENGWDVRGTWEITCPEVSGSHSSRLLCSMNLFVGDCEDNTTDEKMVWAKFDFGSHTGSARFLCPGSKKNYWTPAEMLPGPASRDWLFRWREAGEVLEENALCSLRFKGGAGLKLEGRWNGGEWFEGRKIAEME